MEKRDLNKKEKSVVKHNKFTSVASSNKNIITNNNTVLPKIGIGNFQKIPDNKKDINQNMPNTETEGKMIPHNNKSIIVKRKIVKK